MEIEKLVEQITQEVGKRLAQSAPQDPAALANTIEHSLLNPDICLSAIKKGCEEAKQYGFANVCVSPYYTAAAAELLRGSGVAVWHSGRVSARGRLDQREMRRDPRGDHAWRDRTGRFIDECGDQIGRLRVCEKRSVRDDLCRGKPRKGQGDFRTGHPQRRGAGENTGDSFRQRSGLY